jgi:hypothetical protein
MTSSLLAAGPAADEETKSNEEGPLCNALGDPLFLSAPGLYDRATYPNHWART